MTTDGGGWTVFQRRQNGTQDFGQDWSAYKVGFGELNAEFWLGNEKIYRLTNGRSQGLRVEIEDWNLGKAHALYKNFEIGDERSLYLLNIGVYSGTAGDSFGSSHNKNFTTKDRDNDRNPDKNCATVRGLGGWWYKRCSWGSLNGKYLGNLADYNGITWFHYHDSWLSMKSAEMKLRTEDWVYLNIPNDTLLSFHSQEWSISNFPFSLTRSIASHSMKNLPFHSLLR